MANNMAPPPGFDDVLVNAGEESPAQLPQVAGQAPVDAPPAGFEEGIADELAQEKVSGPGKALEALSHGVRGVLAPFGLNEALLPDQNPAETRDIKEAHPIAYGVGQAAGLVGSGGLGDAGLGNILTKAGNAGSKAVGLGSEATIAEAVNAAKAAGVTGDDLRKVAQVAAEPFSTTAKIGSLAVKSGIENLIFQSSDEIAKHIADDPSSSTETAMMNIGLAGVLGGVLGGGFGATSELWKATEGSKLAQVLKKIQDRVGGVEGQASTEVEDVLARAGIQDVSPEIKAGLSNDPLMKNAFSKLNQTDTTKAGRALQEKFTDFRQQTGDALIEALGKPASSLEHMPEFSKAEAGKAIGTALAKEYEAQVAPLAKEFENLKAKYAGVELRQPALNPQTLERVPGMVDEIAQKVNEVAIREGWTSSASSAEMKMVKRILRELPAQKNLKDLGHFITSIGNNTASTLPFGQQTPLSRAGQLMTRLLKDVESEAIGAQVGAKEGAKALERYQAVRGAYRAQSELREQLNDRLKSGGSTSSFHKGLREMARTDGEGIFSRLSGKKDAQLLEFLQQNYPETANVLKQQHIEELLHSAVQKAGPKEKLSTKSLISGINKMSPELKKFAINPEQMERVNAISEILGEFDKMPHNHSNTARTIDAMMEHTPATAMGLATWMMGHNPLVGYLGGMLAKEIPDAIRLGMLKFAGSSAPIEAEGFKHAVELIHHAQQGEKMLNKSIKGLFKQGEHGLVAMPTEADRMKLDKMIKKLADDQSPLVTVGGKTGHYMPEHGAAMAQTSVAAVNYLNSIRPNSTKQSPLDQTPPPSAVAKAKYNNALNIAQQPLIIVNKIKQGTASSDDLMALKTMYPGLYTKISNQITMNMVEAINSGTLIGYPQRIALSMFLAQPLDSTLTPNGIMSAQPQPPMEPGPAKGGAPKSTSHISKISDMSQTSLQQRQSRASRH